MLTPVRCGAVVVIAVFGLTACGSSGADDPIDPQADPVAYFEAVADATRDEGSYRLDVSTQGAGTEMEGTGVVLLDGEQLTSRVVSRLPGDSLGGDDQLVEITSITTSDAIYTQYPPEDGAAEGPWVVMEGAAIGELLGSGTSGVVDPALFTELGDDLELTATDGDEIDGVATQEITMTLTGEQLAAVAPEGMPTSVTSGIDQADYTFVVGEDLLVREMSVVVGDALTISTTLYDYGVDEAIEIPAEEDTIPFDEYMDDMVDDLQIDGLESPTPGS